MDIFNNLNKLVLINDIDNAINIAEKSLLNLPHTDFHKIIGKNLLHLTEDLINFISKFYNNIKNQFNIKAIYSEMNGFGINYDLWYLELFGYEVCEGLNELFWFSEYDCFTKNGITITGFEDLQNAFRNYHERETISPMEQETVSKVYEICELLIVLRFHELFRESLIIAKQKKLNWIEIPLFATAHDTGLVYEVKV
jgi:hypothetical protein